MRHPDLPARDRRTLLSARAMLRWGGGPQLLWPLHATDTRDCDQQWLVELLALLFAAVVVLGELETGGPAHVGQAA